MPRTTGAHGPFCDDDTSQSVNASGILAVSASVTSRGMREAEMKQIAAWMDKVVNAPGDAGLHETIAGEVRECSKFPAPGILI